MRPADEQNNAKPAADLKQASLSNDRSQGVEGENGIGGGDVQGPGNVDHWEKMLDDIKKGRVVAVTNLPGIGSET